MNIKLESEKIIQELGLIGNPHLPKIESLNELDFRSAKEIAERILVLGYIYALNFDIETQIIKEELVSYNLNDTLSENEKKLLSKPSLSKQDKANISWLPEAIEVLEAAESRIEYH